ncbi:MAG: AMP-binding protein [Burkholderiaceae bacterium]|nr:AMP-binding protein [Burkholderiaceae bacterium]
MSLPRPLPGSWDDLDAMLDGGIDTIPKLLRYQESRFRERVLHRKKDFGIWQRYTWGDVYAQVRSLAMGLAELGVVRGQTVALVGENEPELFWSQYAAQCIGAKVVCLYPDLTAAQMEYILQHSEAVVVVCEDQEQVDKALELEPKLDAVHSIICWDNRGMWKYRHPKLMSFEQVQARGRSRIESHPAEFDQALAAGLGDDIAVLSYTSGTTGLPKACILTHRYLFEAPARMLGALRFKPFTRYLSYISPAWGTEQFFGLTLGLMVPFVVNFPEEPETVQDNIREIGAEALMLSPRQWESLAALVEAKMMDAGRFRRACHAAAMRVGRRVNLSVLGGTPVGAGWRLLYALADLAVLRHLRDNLGLQSAAIAVSGGSGMAPEVFGFFQAMGVPLRNIYGSTEVGLLTLHQGREYDLETVGSWLPVHPRLGTPIEYRVSEEGELQLRGGIGFGGYYKNAQATAKKLVDGWYRTEDAVHLTERGELIYLERIEDMRQLAGGHRYPPQFIENRLRFSPFVKDAMTLGDTDKPFVAAFINIDPSTLGRWAEQRGIGYTSFTDLSQNAAIRELIGQELRAVNDLLPESSRVRRFINLPKELDPDEDELTRSRKLRRKHLEQKYSAFVDAIYSGAREFNASVPIKYQDGRTGTLNATVHVNDLDAPDAAGTSAGARVAVSGLSEVGHG